MQVDVWNVLRSVAVCGMKIARRVDEMLKDKAISIPSCGIAHRPKEFVASCRLLPFNS